MKSSEQKKLLDDLNKVISKMNRTDQDAFKLLQKRDKDEEEFDTLSIARLKELHTRYVISKPKADFNALFKK
ncbi:MAG: hypothetical protein LWX56_10210 [Ignavibacteria bacterium]|nr:hypothetical protein [Ignavibacteria bacterium]